MLNLPLSLMTQKNLETEIESWARFGYALREENRILFHQMLDKCRKTEYSECVNTKGENFTAESLFLILILEQQKMIRELLGRFRQENKGVDKGGRQSKTEMSRYT